MEKNAKRLEAFERLEQIDKILEECTDPFKKEIYQAIRDIWFFIS